MLKNSVSNTQIINVFETLEDNFLGKDPHLPLYYTEDDIPVILEVYNKRKQPNFALTGIECNQRWKTPESLEDKLYRHLNDGRQTLYTCNDWFGVCLMVESYTDIPFEELESSFPIQFTHQHNTGYTAIHAYLYQSYRVPIEVQFHSRVDHPFNTWTRVHNYKKVGLYGCELRDLYLKGELRTEEDYVDALNNFMKGGN